MLIMSLNSWFNSSGYKILSFKTQKLYLLFKSVLISAAVVFFFFLICSIKVNSACFWKLWICSLKLCSKIEACDLVSFQWLLRRMLKGVSLFPTYWSWHMRHISKFHAHCQKCQNIYIIYTRYLLLYKYDIYTIYIRIYT